MKLAFIVPGFSADETDWCIPAHTDIVRALAQSHQVHVYTMRYPHRADTYHIGNATIHSFGGVGSRGMGSALLWRNVIWAIRAEHKRGAFDILHAIFGSEAGGVSVLAGRALHIPSVVWMVDGEMVGLPDIGYGADLIPRQRLMNKLILRYADQILCGCDLLTQEARKRLPKEQAARAETLPLGVNFSRFRHESPVPSFVINTQADTPAQSDAVRDEHPHFVNVGSLLPVKAQDTLLDAFARVQKILPNARLTIAGVGKLERQLRQNAHALHIADSVNFAGNIPHDQLPRLYQSANVFVQASRHEGQGMALLEAAACGCAVCGTDVGALHDLAQQGVALVSKPGDDDALAVTMCQTYSERKLRAAQTWEIVDCEYNLERVCARLQETYVQLCHKHHTQHVIASNFGA